MDETGKKEATWRDERRAYYRNWRAKNKERVKQYNRKYWEKLARQTQQKGER